MTISAVLQGFCTAAPRIEGCEEKQDQGLHEDLIRTTRRIKALCFEPISGLREWIMCYESMRVECHWAVIEHPSESCPHASDFKKIDAAWLKTIHIWSDAPRHVSEQTRGPSKAVAGEAGRVRLRIRALPCEMGELTRERQTLKVKNLPVNLIKLLCCSCNGF